MTNNLNELARRTKRYWYTDGLNEIASGILVLLLGLLNLAVGLTNSIPAQTILLVIGQPLLLILGVFAASKVVRQLKERITYPRTGYVAYHQPKGIQRPLLLVLVMLLAMVSAMMFALIGKRIEETWLPAFTAGMLALFLIYMAYTLGLLRFYFLAIFVFLAGLAAAALRLGDLYATAFLFTGLGLGAIASGAYALFTYLRTTRPPETEQP